MQARKANKKVWSMILVFALALSGIVTAPKTAEAATTSNVKYQTHVQKIGWQGWKLNGQTSGTSGKSLRLEGIKISLDGDAKALGGSITYRTHVQKIGWQRWKTDGAMSGTSGKSLRLEAIQIKLTGAVSKKYDIYYRTHVQKKGWTGWVKNGQTSGTSGKSLRLEAIQIKLVAKGDSATSSDKSKVVAIYGDDTNKPIYGNGVPIYGNGDPIMEERSICNTCGEDITGNTSAHGKAHVLAGEAAGYRGEYIIVGYTQVIVGYEKVIIGYEQKIIGYK